MSIRFWHANSTLEKLLRPLANALLLTVAVGTAAALHAQSADPIPRGARPQSQGTYSLLYSFQCSPDGETPQSGLLRDSSGNFYGTTVGGGQNSHGTVFKVTSDGTESVLYRFAGSPSDGENPTYGSLTVDQSGNLYGTTPFGGEFGYGTVFEVTATGTETVRYNFTGGSDGGYPYGGVARDSAGNIYGTASVGGAYAGGVFFKLTPGGTESVLHSFSGSPSDGASPQSNLTRDSSGNIYGTTVFGGASGFGTVFQVTVSGLESLLYSFEGDPNDGAFPTGGGLLRDPFGNLFGVTVSGGASGDGVVFELTPGGTESVFASFNRPTTGGENPGGALSRGDAFGNVLGTTIGGGSGTGCGIEGCGVLFALTWFGQEIVLHDFSLSSSGDGATPYGGVVRDPSDNFYGTLSSGGAYGCGAVFKFRPPGLDNPGHTSVTGWGPYARY
jgi:uncharacterized repeat protein (TIGR03803 family)